MFTKKAWLVIGVLLTTLVGSSDALPPKSGHLTDAEVVQYIRTGDYNGSLLAQLALARDYLDMRIKLNELQPQSEQKKLAVVAAVDNTALAHEPRLRNIFVHVPMQEGELWQTDEPVIWAFRTFYDYVLSKNIAVFFVTARPEQSRAITEHNLSREGYQKWQGLWMRPAHCGLSIVDEKVRERTEIEQKGYAIVLNIGSKLSDLQGGHSAKVVLLPEPDTHRVRSLDGLNTLI